MNQNLQEVISSINPTKKTSSVKDETAVMQAMINDPTFSVGVYGKNGLESTYNPYADARSMVSNVISSVTGMQPQEAQELASTYQFDKNDASTFVNISKEFINTYMTTGRKLPLGGRETSNVSLVQKQIAERTRKAPVSIGSTEENMVTTPAYNSIRVIAPCPPWVK